METFLDSLSKKNVILLSVVLIVSLVFFRFSFGGFNFSHFVVAGSDFVTPDSLHPHLIINKGQGYDGQFFYRYAHNPLNFEKTAHGVTVDHIEYRIQRTLYPTLAYLISLGGNENLVPFSLVLLNVLSFIGIVILSLKICEHYSSNNKLALLPLFLFGGFMALSRDTSEIFEAFFFLFALYSFIKKNLLAYLLCATLTIFSRETSLIAIGPLSLFFWIKMVRSSGFNFKVILKGILLVIPLILIALWKYYLHASINSENLVDGSQNLSLPFLGVFFGAQENFNFNNIKSILESIFWFSFLAWNIWIVVEVLKSISFKKIFEFSVASVLSLVFLVWGIFSAFLGPAIYVDDWGYVRIFTLWNLLGMIILMIKNKQPSRYFVYYSVIILVFLLVRLIIRV